MTPLWRKAYDAIERPLAAGSEAWIQSDSFMDLTAIAFRIQRRLLREAQQNTERWLHLWGWPSRADVQRLSNQVGSLERQVRDLRSGRARTVPRTPSEARPSSTHKRRSPTRRPG